jgi:hypothetical protein
MANKTPLKAKYTGSDTTALAEFESGDTFSSDLLDTGTSANQIVKLDGSAKLPAVDGSALTNLPSSGGGIGGWTEITDASVTSSTSYIDWNDLDTTTYSEFKVVMTDVGGGTSDTTQKFEFSDASTFSTGGGVGWGFNRSMMYITNITDNTTAVFGDYGGSSTSNCSLYWRWYDMTPYAHYSANNRMSGEYYINMQDDVMHAKGYFQGKFEANKYGVINFYHSLDTGANKPQSFRMGTSWNYSGTFTLYGR